MNRRHFASKLILATVLFFTGCIVTFILTREWNYSLVINEVKVIEADGEDYLKVSLQSHPPWAQQHANTYVLNVDDRSIKIVSSYVLWSPFSIKDSSETNITNFNVLIPGKTFSEGAYKLRHYGRSGKWETRGVVNRDLSGNLKYLPH